MEYRIDDLARAGGTTTRNVRVYQDRGLLPAPLRRGRTAVYSETHLARLRLVVGMLDRGYTLALIKEMLDAWEGGQELGDLLGLEQALAEPWSDELPGYIGRLELRRMFGGQATRAAIDRAVELGLLVRDGTRYAVPSPRLLHAGHELVAAGVPLAEVLELAAELQRHADAIAALFVGTVHRALLDRAGPDRAGGLPDLTALVRRLRPLAQSAAAASLARAMGRQVPAALGQTLVRELATDPGAPAAGEG